MNIPELYDYQVPHYEKISKILQESNFAFDLSKMGSGKSIVAIHIMRAFEKALIISFPAVINQNWKHLVEKYKLRADMISINKLRGSNNLLERIPKYKKEKVKYKKTSDFKKFKGLIILDEIQMAKNDNLSYAAIKAVVKNNKILLMSGTLIDNFDQMGRYLKIVDHGKTYKSITELNDLFFSSYSSKMIPPVSKYVIENVYCHASGHEEKDKAHIFSDIALQVISRTNCKAIIGVFHINALEAISKLLKKNNPAIISGSTKNAERDKIINQFQEPNNKLNLIIANINIICTGINLDDEDGRFPRTCIISPNSYTMNTNQLLARFSRANTKSTTVIKIIYTSESDYKLATLSLKKQEIIDAL